MTACIAQPKLLANKNQMFRGYMLNEVSNAPIINISVILHSNQNVQGLLNNLFI
jgi:hypothetical protein